MSSASASSDRERACKASGTLWNAMLAVGTLAAGVFLTFPSIDIAMSTLLYVGQGVFLGQQLPWVKVLREIFIAGFFLGVGVSLVGLFRTRKGPAWLRLTFIQWLFLATCLVVGAGVVANMIFKDQWGRARPKTTIEFGGEKTFTPALVPANQCARNCSFVSGEAASIFVLFYAGAFLVPSGAAAMMVAGTLLGLVAGLVRVSQGAHFLSDVIFAGVFMAATVVLVHRAMFASLYAEAVASTASASRLPRRA